MKNHLNTLMISALLMATFQFAHADCLKKMNERINLNISALQEMKTDSKNIFSIDSEAGWWIDHYNENRPSHLSQDSFILSTNVIIYPAIMPIEIGVSSSINGSNFSTQASENTALRAEYKSNLNFTRRLIVEAKIGGGKNLQKFVQDLRDEGSDISREESIKAIIQLNKSDDLCPNGIPVNPDQFTAIMIETISLNRENKTDR